MKYLIVSFLTAMICVPATADTFIRVVPPPGSETANVSGINDNYAIAGSYDDQNGEHCFYGPANGTYKTFDVKGASRCGLGPINNAGVMTGGSDQGPFVVSAKGKVSFVTKDGSRLKNGNAGQINNNQMFVGYYTGDDGLEHGFYGQGSAYKSDINLGVSTGSMLAFGLNDKGAVVGYAQFDFDGEYHAFLYSNGLVTTIDYPGSGISDTRPFTINDEGLVGGFYTKQGTDYAFLYDSVADTFTTVEVKKAEAVAITGVNSESYAAVSTGTGPFILCPVKKAKCAVKD
jgi:probable HAF family extracellular repeat protein